MMVKNILVLAILLFTFGCKEKGDKKEVSNTPEVKVKTEIMENEEKSLGNLLNERKEASSKKGSEEKKKIYADGIAAVKNSGILSKALTLGDKAPNFTLNNALGNPVSLYNELEQGPVVLTWYRGGWCPYCNITLHYLQEKLPEFKNAGATLMALTPELPDKSLDTSEKNKLEFNVLSDIKNVVGKTYGVVFELTDDVAKIYEKAFGLHENNGDESNELPLAATYIIDQQGVIQYAFLDADYRNRAEPDAILEALKALKTN